MVFKSDKNLIYLVTGKVKKNDLGMGIYICE
ncbi:hypothetical protein B0S90_0271 [Caldicellulosiruptor bescii]|uniref:Uncharacterized protein n=3 Tax=Caldicellulosiruptor TaxID=44000 RepID=B9ML46_CALBD|nr:hypothetical protein Athe_0011 [Caldicellulosiruptor bescii DSM 6725]ADQ44933.1 hypothetical protein Calkro_0013 [Caldicellulosiruptor kronotskyensis 2002]PBC88371.1 hypothetical protein B0S87_1354 [Caldicellulosiruptor bescii]PBC92148.1 hypothetical protein B0S89_2639 [Caldicellulosiruptor bescii]PBD05042.1 hypothetical protein B0S85_2767 [Caldicellulosiruptor bescii]